MVDTIMTAEEVYNNYGRGTETEPVVIGTKTLSELPGDMFYVSLMEHVHNPWGACLKNRYSDPTKCKAAKKVAHTSLLDKAREVKAHGEAERENFTPRGWPKKSYQYWADNVNWKKVPERENWCHYWRVAVFWSPWLRFRKGFVRAANSKATEVVLGILAVVAAIVAVTALVMTGAWLPFLGVTLGLLLGFGSIFSGIGLGYNPEAFTRGERILMGVLAVVGLIGIPVFGIARLVKNWNHDWDDTVKKWLLRGAVGAGVAWLLVLAVIGTINIGWWLVPLILTIGGAAGLAIYWISRIFSYASAKAEATDRKRSIEVDALVASGEFVPKGPGRVRKFFVALADFFVLAAQVVRVKKWGICPTMDMDELK